MAIEPAPSEPSEPGKTFVTMGGGHPPVFPEATGVEARVIADIAERQQRGIAKYGTTVEDNPLALRQWTQHFYEELLDGAVYAKKIIEKVEEIDQRIGAEFVLIDTARMQLLTHLDVLGHRYPAMREDLEKMRPIVLSLPTVEDGRV